MTIDKWW